MRCTLSGTVLISGLILLGIASTAQAQGEERRVSIEARGGVNVPTFDISDAVDAGPSVGLGAGVQLAPKLWLMEMWISASTRGRNLPEVDRPPT